MIILNVIMSESEDMQTCGKFRNIKALADTSHTFLTAAGDDYSQMAGFDARAEDYSTKPIGLKVLVTGIWGWTNDEGDDSAQDDIGIYREEYVNKGKQLVLPRKGCELLALLTSKSSKIYSRDSYLARFGAAM